MQDPTKLDLYNKLIQDHSAGTLIGNWQEERILRENTNVGRNIPLHHITKSRANLYLAPPEEMNFTNPNLQVSTAEKILGERKNLEFSQTNTTYGAEKNKSDLFNKHGKKFRHQYMENHAQFSHNFHDNLVEENKIHSKRYLDTTNKTEFGQKEFQSQIGKMIMKDQNYQPCELKKDDLYFQEHNRTQIPVSSENIKVNPLNSYIKDVPVTFYDEKKSHGTYFKSKGTHFGINNEFVKSYSDYKQIKL